MPWITENGKRRFEARGPIPHVTLPDPNAPHPDLEGAARLERERAAFMLWWKRHVADYCEIHLYCPRIACRRAAACRSRDAACHDENIDVLRQYFYPEVRKAMNARIAAESNDSK